MVSRVNAATGPLEPGTYVIRSASSSSQLNLVTSQYADLDADIRMWNTLRSPTERWCVEPGDGGYLIRNATSGHYMSFKTIPLSLAGRFTHIPAIAVRQPISWNIVEKGSVYHIIATSNPRLVLDVWDGDNHDGALVIVCDDYHGEENQQWTFERVDNVQPFSYLFKSYIGAVPAGVYQIGCHGRTVRLTDGELESTSVSPSTILSIATGRQHLEGTESAVLYLGHTTNGPSPNQMWALESGRCGYRLKNLGVQAYLGYADSEFVLEKVEDGSSSVTEWVTVAAPGGYPFGPFDVSLCLSSNRSIELGITVRGSHKVRRRFPQEWDEDEDVFMKWKFEAFDERFLDALSYLH